MYEDQNMYPDAEGFLETLRQIPDKADAERIRKQEEARRAEDMLMRAQIFAKNQNAAREAEATKDQPNALLAQLEQRISQGSKLDELMRNLSPQDIENQMREQVWGKPAKSKLGKIGQAILKPIAIAGGAPTQFGAPAMAQYLKMEEQARKGRQTDYAALQGGARVQQSANAAKSKTLLDFAKENNKSVKDVASYFLNSALGQENIDVKLKQLDVSKQHYERLDASTKDKIEKNYEVEKQKLHNNPIQFYKDVAELYQKSPEDASLLLNAVGAVKLMESTGRLAAGGGQGKDYTRTYTSSKLQTNADGTQQFLPERISTTSQRPAAGGTGPIDFAKNPAMAGVLQMLNAGKAGAATPPPQLPSAAPAMPGQPPPQGGGMSLPPQAATKPQASVAQPRMGPNMPKLRRRSNINPNEDYFLPETPKEREATQALGGYGALANKVSQGLTEAFNAGGFDDSAVLNAVAKLREEFLGGKAKSASGDNLSFVLDELSNKTAGNPARMKAATAMKDMRELISERTLMVSGKAASDQERAWIKSFMPNPGQANNPESLLHDASRLAAGAIAAQKIKQMGLWNLPADVLGDVRNAIDNWSMSRVRTLKENRGLRAAGKTVKDPSDADIEQVIIDAISKSKDKDRIKRDFQLEFGEPTKTGLTKVQELMDSANRKKVEEDLKGLPVRLRR